MVSKYTWYMAEHLPLRYEFRPDETKMKSEMKKAALHRIPSTFTSRLTNTMHFSRKVCYLSFSPFTRRSLFCAVLCGCVQNPRIRKTVEAFTSLWDSSADLKSTEDSTTTKTKTTAITNKKNVIQTTPVIVLLYLCAEPRNAF